MALTLQRDQRETAYVYVGVPVIAALAAMLAVEQGKQVALAAPTELLAEQHLNNLRGWLEPLGVRIAWLAGKVTGKARARVMEQVANGEAQVVVGTHALMQEAVVFQDLALAIVDEQHRFGVHITALPGALAQEVARVETWFVVPARQGWSPALHACVEVLGIDQEVAAVDAQGLVPAGS